jgi:uncharacterized membrane protein YhhN
MVVSILNLYFVKRESIKGKIFTKPLLMPLLIFFYMFNASKTNYLLVVALTFGFLGDVFLLREANKTFLLGGIKAFLMGHLFYIIAFIVKSNFLKGVPLWFSILLLPYAGVGVIIAKRLFSSMKSMKLQAGIYMVVILAMSFTSLLTVFTASTVSFLLSFAGSLFFIVSDTMLAFDIFKVHEQKNHVYIMVTYILAQLLITLSFLINL